VEYREGVYVGYRYYDAKQMDVLFPFGHGLSYTRFAYSNLRLDRPEMRDTDTLRVTVDVQNAGDVAAKEVVQLYVRPMAGEVPRPVRELKGFEKIALRPGETKRVTFTLGKRAFAYYNVKLKDWHVESGRYEVQVGASSWDIRLSAEVSVASTVEVPVTFTQYSPVSQVLKSAKGQAILGPVLRQAQAMAQENIAEGSFGEGDIDMMAIFMMQSPLCALVSFGIMGKEQVLQLVAALNA